MNKSIAIMQPYFFPYIGYWQLINSVDEFVVYDNIKYTKKGWINRNIYISGGQEKHLTLPLEKASDYLDVNERKIADDFDKIKLMNQINGAYRQAPFYEETCTLLKSIMIHENRNLFDFIFQSIQKVAKHLEINTPLIISSHIDVDHSLKAGERVMAICKKLEADHYINPIGGLRLYDKDEFKNHGIKLDFLRADKSLLPFLSILHVLMINGTEKTKSFLDLYNIE